MVGIQPHQRLRLAATGQVQGVGFRPFVYRLAADEGVTGFVINDAGGVVIEVQGTPQSMYKFVHRLHDELPPLAQISQCEQTELPPLTGEERFEIRPSAAGEMVDAQVTVDTATCEDCLRELRDPSDPRHGYPFINCTNCGPRYSIVRRIPYDRANTTMAEFAMCSLCAGEYRDPASRRFHAQPVACPKCGPAVWLVDKRGRQIACEDAIHRAATMLRAGCIVALKGLGGFHLACRADDDEVVRRLRLRKRRDAKPFALMAADLEQASALCELNESVEKLLSGPIRPIVLLPRRKGARIAPSVAEGLDTLGIMLPYTPLHHLLFDEGTGPLVMTSGNYYSQPLVKDNDEAISCLGEIADAILLHNRRIERRIDDSVVQWHPDGRERVVRRGRGYAPQPVRLSIGAEGGPAVLAVGAELKNTVCIYAGGRAVPSEHIGDLKDGRVYRHFLRTIDHLESLFEFRPQLLAADMHPQYLSMEYALRRHRGQLAGREALPIIRVQHHHAHLASCLADNGRAEEVIGLICDGTGYGDDGAVWGCEVLRGDLYGYQRLGHLRYLPLPGGDAAAVEPWRPALSAVHDAFGEKCLTAMQSCPLDASKDQVQAVLEMLTLGVNCPPSSSLGRWFDAVAALCGLVRVNRYEAEAAMRLEAAAGDGKDAYSYRLSGTGPFEIDLRPMVEGIVEDLAVGADTAYVSAKFHNTVARFLAAAARRARDETNLGTVALSGGCFANRYLAGRLTEALRRDGFEVLTHRTIPCNDGGVSLGQAVIAACQWRRRNVGRIARSSENRK